jgi:hypothetical protein
MIVGSDTPSSSDGAAPSGGREQNPSHCTDIEAARPPFDGWPETDWRQLSRTLIAAYRYDTVRKLVRSRVAHCRSGICTGSQPHHRRDVRGNAYRVLFQHPDTGGILKTSNASTLDAGGEVTNAMAAAP